MDDKATLRQRLKQARAGLEPEQMAREAAAVAAALSDLPEIGRARSVFCYLSSPEELATDAVIDALLARGVEVAVPLVIDRTTMVAVAFPGWDAVETGAFRIRQPKVSGPVLDDIDVVVTPALGFSRTGARIGYGGGYYDRWFEAHPRAHRIGVAFDSQLLPSLPLERHDVLMHRLITASHRIECAG
jgi:5-formyltetrahydrofolate cyclo-ligase